MPSAAVSVVRASYPRPLARLPRGEPAGRGGSVAIMVDHFAKPVPGVIGPLKEAPDPVAVENGIDHDPERALGVIVERLAEVLGPAEAVSDELDVPHERRCHDVTQALAPVFEPIPRDV